MAIETHPGGIWRTPSLMLPLLITGIIYLSSTTDRAVVDYDEGYYAQVAKHMAESGDWVTPYANGVRFLEKPPLLYWLTAASFKVLGSNEIALRLPTALAVIALVCVVMLTAGRVLGQQGILIAGLSTACSAGTYLFTRETLHDIWLVLFIALTMYAFLRWYLDPPNSLRFALLLYAAMAGAFMCKSLIGIAFPVMIVAVFFLLSREHPKWRKLHVLPGSLLFLGLTVPWHWFAALQNRDFLHFFFVGEQFMRFLGKREPPVLWSVPVLTFWILVLVWFFPWTAFLPAAFAEKRKSITNDERTLARLAFAWAGVILVFFSISDRLEHYAFPALPALSLLVSGALSRSDDSKLVQWAFRGLAALGILILVTGAGVGIWLAGGHRMEYASIGSTDRLGETDFSILAEMPAEVLRNLLMPAAVTVVCLAIGFLTALWFETRRRHMQALIIVAAVMTVICGMIHWSLIICEDFISSRKFALAIADEARPEDRLVVVGDYESANSLSFYQPLHVEVFGGVAYALIPGMEYPDAPKIVLTEEEFRAAWRSRNRLFVLIPQSRIGELKPNGIKMIQVLNRTLVRNH